MQNFQIELDGNKEVFQPGEEIRGAVVVDVAQSMKCKEINVVLVGVSWSCWSTSSDGDSPAKFHTGHQSLVNLQALLFGGSSEALDHPTGRHTYRFLFKLPSRLPTSFIGKNGSIEYQVEARVVQPWKFDHKKKKVLTVNEIVDINLPQYSTVPFAAKQKQIGNFCCVAGNLSMQASLDRSGYCPGERILMPCVRTFQLEKCAV